MSLKKLPILLSFLYHNLIIIYTNGRKVSTDADVNGLSSAIYRNSILQSQLKIYVLYTAKLLSGKTFMVRVQNCHLRENFCGSMLVDLHCQSTRP